MADRSRPFTGASLSAPTRAVRAAPDRLGALLAVLTPLSFLLLLYVTIVDEAPTTWAAAGLYAALAVLLCLRVARRHTWLPFVLPALSLYLLFAVFPALNAFRVSLYAWSGFGEPTDYVGLANYQSVVVSPVFWNALWHNVLIFLSIFVLQNVVGLFLAVLIHARPRGYEFYRAAIFMPGILSLVATGLMWQVIFGSNIGLLTPLLQDLGLGALTRDWLGDSTLTFWLLVLVQFWQWMGLPMIIYLAGLQNVPEELIAAARIDGANDAQAFRHVTFPLLAPAFTVMTALCFIVMFKTFDIPFVMAGPGGAPNGTTDVLSLVIYRTAFGLGTTVRTSLQQGYAVAIGVVMSLALLVATTVQLAVLRRREVGQ